jgi:hypothetical protein
LFQNRITVFEDNWEKIHHFYENYSSVSIIDAIEFDKKKLGKQIENELDNFVALREEKKQKEIEEKNLIEKILKQKQKEEEEKIAKKTAEEQAAALQAQKEAEEKAAAEAAEGKLKPVHSLTTQSCIK